MCSVDLFMLISGFFSVNKTKVDFWKPVCLIAQVIIFSMTIYVLRCVLGNNGFDFKSLLIHSIPTNYFVILYVSVYMISPYINVLIHSMDIKHNRKMLLILFMLFSVQPTFVDVLSKVLGRNLMGLSTIGILGSQWGYTIVTFILMYIIGAILNKDECIIKYLINKCKCYLCFVIIGITLWSIFFKSPDIYWYYCNPLVILAAVFVFVLFLNLRIKTNKVINSLAKSVFTVFLLHHLFLKYLKIQVYVNYSTPVMLCHILVSVVCIFLICYPIGLVYNFLEDRIVCLLKRHIKLPGIDLNKY